MDLQLEVEDRQSAFQNRVASFAIMNIEHLDIFIYLEDAYKFFKNKMMGLLQSHRIVKVQGYLKAEFEKYDSRDDSTLYQHFYFATKSKLFDIDTMTKSWYRENIRDEILKRIDNFEIEGSGWKLSATKELLIVCYQYKGFRGASYIDLPAKIKAKRAVINVQNFDNACFKWAILSKLRSESGRNDNLQRVLSYTDSSFLNGQIIDFSHCVFPMDISMIQKFEKINTNISINVYAIQNDDNKNSEKKTVVVPLRITKSVKINHINLLLLRDKNNSHYCWIKNFSALVSSQLSKNTRKKHICDRCLHYFISEAKLAEHFENCVAQNKCPIVLPSKGENVIQFENFKNQLRAPFCIYADIESILEPMEEGENSSTSNAYQRHIPYSIGYYLKSDVNTIKSMYKAFRGPNCIKFFVNDLYNLYKKFEAVFETKKEMRLTDLEQVHFHSSSICHICTGNFKDLDIKVRDHCHLTGKYRGAAHQSCNLTYQHSRIIPVIFHNLSGYDSHFLIQDLMVAFKGDISLIPLNCQNYISFTKTVDESSWKHKFNTNNISKTRNTIKFKFLDSFRFMSSSLDELAKNLPSEDKKILRSQWSKRSSEDIKLLERKGIFPYDYVDSWRKLKEKSLPPITDFYSKLYECDISQAEYDHAQLVWNRFDVKTIGQYSDLYLQTDVLLLADVFEKFRESCKTIYTLDPAHYYTTPGFSWDAMLKHTKVQIELFTDIDMIMFIERGIRGGLSQCSTRYAAANNKYMNNFNSNNELISYLLYLDVNNLYGYAMMKKLPLRNFQWDDCRNIDEIFKTASKSNNGFILEVDLEYPRELHDEHKDYPMCPERMCPQNGKHEKLLLTLYNKKNYVIHHKMLRFVLTHGLKLTSIHRVLKFEESEWLKPYIDLNTELRTKALSSFEKNLYKLMSNAIYGKTMENVRNRVDIKLKSEWDGRFGAGNLISKPNFKRCTIFSENLVAIELEPTEIKMFKPIVVGMSILDLSKICMYEFHYNQMLKKYGDRCKVLYTDTDSFIYKITAKDISDKEFDIYEDIKMEINLYDTSDYPANNPMNMPQRNKKKPGLMKDECCGKIMTEFAGVRSKAYSFKMDNTNSVQKAKGVTRNAIKLKLQFHHYVECVKNLVIVEGNQNVILSKLHKLYTVRQKKIFLSPFDDKRQILSNNIDTLPWGYNPLSL